MMDEETREAQRRLDLYDIHRLYSAIIFFLVIGCIMAFGIGVGVGVDSGRKVGLFQEHCEQAGGRVQKNGTCAKITIELVKPKE